MPPDEQLALPRFGGPTARRDGPDTSLEAGRAVARRFGKYQRLAALVAEAHLAHPAGLTDAELAAELPDEHPPSVGKRRRDLVVAGVLVDSGRRRLTPRGRMAIVWRLARPGEAGEQVVPAKGRHAPPPPPLRLGRRPLDVLADLAPPASGSAVRDALTRARLNLAKGTR